MKNKIIIIICITVCLLLLLFLWFRKKTNTIELNQPIYLGLKEDYIDVLDNYVFTDYDDFKNITNSSIFMFLVVAVICGILWFATIDGGSFQQNCRLLLRNCFALLAGLWNPTSGKKELNYFIIWWHYFCSLWLEMS